MSSNDLNDNLLLEYLLASSDGLKSRYQVTKNKPFTGRYVKNYSSGTYDRKSSGDRVEFIELANGTKLDTYKITSSEVVLGVWFESQGRDRVTQTIKITHEA